MTLSRMVLLLEGREDEQATLTKAYQLAQGMSAELCLLHLVHGSRVRERNPELSTTECSASHALGAKAGISRLMAGQSQAVRYENLVVDDVVDKLGEWLTHHPTQLLLVGSRHRWMDGSLARLLLYKLPVDIQVCHEPWQESLKAAG